MPERDADLRRAGRFAVNPEAARQRLDRLFAKMVAQPAIKHALAVVESGERAFRWAGVAGEAHPGGAPLREDTPIWIASVTKLYIAVATLKLYERGLVALDAPIGAYLPQELIGGIHRLGGTDHTGAITVQHLLGHSSGLPDFIEAKPKGGRSLFDQVLESDRAWTIPDAIRLVRDELTPHFAPQPLAARRQRIHYSDTNYQLLMAIIEAVQGQPIAQAFDELLFEPLGLRDTYHPGTRPEAPEPATTWAGEQPLRLPLAMVSFGDLISTAHDLLSFMRALVRGEVFDRPNTRDLMMGHWNTFGLPRSLPSISPGWPIQYGLGMMRFAMPGPLGWLNPMPPIVGHTGASGSWLFYCPSLDLYLCGTVDQVEALATPFRFVPSVVRALAR